MTNRIEITTLGALLESTVQFVSDNSRGYKEGFYAAIALDALFDADDVSSEEFWAAYHEMRDLYQRVKGIDFVQSQSVAVNNVPTAEIVFDAVPYLEVGGERLVSEEDKRNATLLAQATQALKQSYDVIDALRGTITSLDKEITSLKADAYHNKYGDGTFVPPTKEDIMSIIRQMTGVAKH